MTLIFNVSSCEVPYLSPSNGMSGSGSTFPLPILLTPIKRHNNMNKTDSSIFLLLWGGVLDSNVATNKLNSC